MSEFSAPCELPVKLPPRTSRRVSGISAAHVGRPSDVFAGLHACAPLSVYSTRSVECVGSCVAYLSNRWVLSVPDAYFASCPQRHAGEPLSSARLPRVAPLAG